jgi:FKBP-type peptidyl-prolyl cis-trans isomerase
MGMQSMLRNGFIAVAVVVGLAACTPAAPAIDKNDPYKTLYPWKHDAKGVMKTENGVEYVVVSKGADPKAPFPSPADRVEVNYDGRLAATGEKFDSSYDTGEPATFRLNQVIPGWTEGLQKMQPGDQVMFWIPAKLGYGERGAGGRIPPNADLMFRVELNKIIPALVADAAAWKKATPWPVNSVDVKHTGSGLEYFVIESGKGDKPAPTDSDIAKVQFEGHLDDGSLAATTLDDQQPQYFPINQLVPGWAEALKLMHPGDHWMVHIPSSLMYDKEGDGRIPPNANVTFEVILEDVAVGAAPPPEPTPPQADKKTPAKPKSGDKAKAKTP